MTQYHYEKPAATSVESALVPSTQDSKILENRVKRLSDRVDQQTEHLREIQRAVRRLQNELKAAVNAFNLKNHG